MNLPPRALQMELSSSRMNKSRDEVDGVGRGPADEEQGFGSPI